MYGSNILASPINTPVAAPPTAQLIESFSSLIEAAAHVVNANVVAAPPEKRTKISTMITTMMMTVQCAMLNEFAK